MPLPCRRWWLFCEGLGGKDHLASRSPGVLTTPRLQMAAQRREGPSWPEIAGRRGIDGWPVKAGCVVLSGLPGRCPSGRAQPASGSAAGGPPALPLDIVMELKARLAGGLGQALLQLPVGQGRSWNRGACTPNTEVQTLGTAETYFATAVKAKSTLRPVLALVSMNGSPNSCKEPWAASLFPRGAVHSSLDRNVMKIGPHQRKILLGQPPRVCVFSGSRDRRQRWTPGQGLQL